MKRTIRNTALLLAVIVAAIGFIRCSDDDDDNVWYCSMDNGKLAITMQMNENKHTFYTTVTNETGRISHFENETWYKYKNLNDSTIQITESWKDNNHKQNVANKIFIMHKYENKLTLFYASVEDCFAPDDTQIYYYEFKRK